ncbi:MAG: HupE/UreJ family protein [Pseudomonadota bacterium]
MRRRLPVLALLLALPGPAEAHLVGVEFGEFYAGALHLTLAPEYLAGLLGLAVLSGLQAKPVAVWSVLALPLALTLGAFAGVLAPGLSAQGLQSAIGASLLAVGLLGLIAVALPGWALGLATFGLGVVHGYDNGASAAGSEVDWRLYAAGIAVAGTVIGTLLTGLAVALVEQMRPARLGLRVLASWIATVGLLFLALTLLQNPG